MDTRLFLIITSRQGRNQRYEVNTKGQCLDKVVLFYLVLLVKPGLDTLPVVQFIAHLLERVRQLRNVVRGTRLPGVLTWSVVHLRVLCLQVK